MSADRETGRLEAAELAMQFDAPIEASFWDLARTGLSAADDWDRENGYRVVTWDEWDERFDSGYEDGRKAGREEAEEAPGYNGRGGKLYLASLLEHDPTPETLRAVAAVLREVAEQ